MATNTNFVELFQRLALLRQEQRKRRDTLVEAEERTAGLKTRNREGRQMAEWKPRQPSAKAPLPND
jgi:hypothetical protein